MKKILFILLLFFLLSCSENKDKLCIDYIIHFEYLTNQIDFELDDALQQAEYRSNDLLRGHPQKTGPTIKRIKEIHNRSNYLFDLIERSKNKILDIHNLRNNNIEDLRDSKTKLSVIKIDQIIEELKKYRVELYSIIKEVRYTEQVSNHIKNTLETDRLAKLPIFKTSRASSSELYAILCMLQYRVKLIESNIVQHLYSQLDYGGGYWFVNLNAIVIPKAKEIYTGDTFEAEIFLAATDTTSSPTIMIGDRVLKVHQGKAYYKKIANSKDTGNVTEYGKIYAVRGYTGYIDSIPFTIKYKIIK